MKHPPICGFPPHRPPCPRPPSTGFLLPKIIASEKRIIPRLCTTIEACDLPECAFPLRLTSVLPSGESPTWTISQNACNCAQTPVCVQIPVCLLLCDSCGRSYRSSAAIEVDLWLPPSFVNQCSTQLSILPCIRMLCSEFFSCDCRFDVQLHLALDFYLTRPEVLHTSRPACPDLPLYPPPICH